MKSMSTSQVTTSHHRQLFTGFAPMFWAHKHVGQLFTDLK